MQILKEIYEFVKELIMDNKIITSIIVAILVWAIFYSKSATVPESFIVVKDGTSLIFKLNEDPNDKNRAFVTEPDGTVWECSADLKNKTLVMNKYTGQIPKK